MVLFSLKIKLNFNHLVKHETSVKQSLIKNWLCNKTKYKKGDKVISQKQKILLKNIKINEVFV